MPQFSYAFWKVNMYFISLFNIIPPSTHSGVKEISSRANSVGWLHPTSASKATLKGMLLERATFAYIHLFSSFLLEDHIRISMPCSVAVLCSRTCWQWNPRDTTESVLSNRGVQLAKVTYSKLKSTAACLGSTVLLRYASNPHLLGYVTEYFY